MSKKTAVIIGAGPAGLTAALELLARTDVQPIILEKSEHMGGISRTVNVRGNRIDIGGHRFFSKSDRIMDWWLRRLPMQAVQQPSLLVSYQNKTKGIEGSPSGPDPDIDDRVMLLRHRKSRIYFLRKFFDYPVTVSKETLASLGMTRSAKIIASYLKSTVVHRPETSLEDFFINRFGTELYLTFFKSYTEKVWGVPCSEISSSWGAQRVKGLSLAKAAAHFAKSLFKKNGDLAQKDTETSLIEQFLYPKHGPGQMWEQAAAEVRALGGQILTSHEVTGLQMQNGAVNAVRAVNSATGETTVIPTDYAFSTMPVRDLFRAMDPECPADLKQISEGLVYRDFITVGLLLDDLAIRESDGSPIQDNWIYIQEPDVQVGRLQIFNNWSPYMVADPAKTWVGLEYFCFEGDELWTKPDAEMAEFAADELAKIDIIRRDAVRDSTVLHMEKTYPAYFGTYDKFDTLQAYLDGIPNLFPIGRNGMHRYNNQDHSMLTAMAAVDAIESGSVDKSAIWAVNTEQEYHEDKA